ncbi:MAG: Methyltransferase [Thermoproteota archaeon]|nr:Methyltransferase [Thermoproteota archaeon]
MRHNSLKYWGCVSVLKNFPELNQSFEDLFKMLLAPTRLKLLLTGIELKVFNQLSKPTSVDALVQAIGTHPGNTGIFFDSLTAIDLIQKKNGLYRNSPIAQAFLVEDSPTYLRAALQLLHSQLSPENLSKLIKERPPPMLETAFSEDMFAQEYASLEQAGYAQIMVDAVSELPEFPSFRKILDLAGGLGIVGVAVVAAHPSMKGVIFDLPPMVKVAETFIRKYGMEDKMEVLGGDGFRDSIGDGYDLVLVCSSLQSYMDKFDSVVKKVYDALNPGGVFISYFYGLTYERTKPEITVLLLLSMAMAGQDAGFDQEYIADSML